MRMITVATLFLASLCGASAAPEVVFDENFEADYYESNMPVPTGPGVIHHGEWSKLSQTVSPGCVSDAEGNAFLELRPKEQFAGEARAIGKFNAPESGITDALTLRLSFKMTAPLDTTLYIQIIGGDGKSKGTVSMNNDGFLTASFGGVREEVAGPIAPDTWYQLEFLMPNAPKTKSIYSVNLYEADGTTLIASKKGELARSVEENGSNYISLDIQHKVRGETLIIDNIKAISGPQP